MLNIFGSKLYPFIKSFFRNIGVVHDPDFFSISFLHKSSGKTISLTHLEWFPMYGSRVSKADEIQSIIQN